MTEARQVEHAAHVTVIARFQARPGMESALRAELMKLLAPTRAEPGCLNYDLHEETGGGPAFLFHENWASEADLAAHLSTPHVTGCLERCTPMLARPVEITRWRPLGAR